VPSSVLSVALAAARLAPSLLALAMSGMPASPVEKGLQAVKGLWGVSSSAFKDLTKTTTKLSVQTWNATQEAIAGGALGTVGLPKNQVEVASPTINVVNGLASPTIAWDVDSEWTKPFSTGSPVKKPMMEEAEAFSDFNFWRSPTSSADPASEVNPEFDAYMFWKPPQPTLDDLEGRSR